MDVHGRTNSPWRGASAFQRALIPALDVPHSETPIETESAGAALTASNGSRPLLACAWGRSVAHDGRSVNHPKPNLASPIAIWDLAPCVHYSAVCLRCALQGGNRASQLHRCQRRVAVMPESLPAPRRRTLASCIGRAPSIFGASASQRGMFRFRLCSDPQRSRDLPSGWFQRCGCTLLLPWTSSMNKRLCQHVGAAPSSPRLLQLGLCAPFLGLLVLDL